MNSQRCFLSKLWLLAFALLSDNILITTTAQAQSAEVTRSTTTTTEIVPGLQFSPSNVTCCPTLPLIGPAWMVDPTSLTLRDVNYQCSFVPAHSRPMVFVFQPNGVINGFSDENACHYFHGTYQIFGDGDGKDNKGGVKPSPSFTYKFKWNRWKSQPYGCLPINCGWNDNDIDIFWTRISSSVRTLAITGYTNIELRDSIGQAIVRLEAVPDSYTCHFVNNNNNNNNNNLYDSRSQIDSSYCHPRLNIPNLEKLQGDTNSLLSSTAMDFSPNDLAIGGGGIPSRDWDTKAINNQWRGIPVGGASSGGGSGGNAASKPAKGERSGNNRNKNGGGDGDPTSIHNNDTATSSGNDHSTMNSCIFLLAMVFILSFS